jgi:hypothetical protein
MIGTPYERMQQTLWHGLCMSIDFVCNFPPPTGAHAMKRFEIFATINANAHNPKYGRDCHAAPVSVGIVAAADEYAARDTAADHGMTYNPAAYEYVWIYSHAVELAALSPLMLDFIEAVKAYAIANYETDGWDIVAECYSDDDIAELIGNAATPADAIAAVKADNALQTMHRNEICAENY